MHRSFSVLAAFVAIAGAAAVIPACSDEGEGERCDVKGVNNGNDECQSGLTCKLGASLPSHPNSDVCCPADPAQATTVICSAASGIDSGTAPDVDVADTTIADVTTDTSTSDTGADTSVDATPDTSTTDGSTVDSATPDAGADADLDAPADG